MDHRRAKELLAAYALGATPEDERPGIEAHLPTCAACRSQLADFQYAATQLVEGPAADGQSEALDRSWDEVKRHLRAGDR